ncbi:MAG: multicopper oxidase family protein [Methylobacter sp.]|nr:multicopper oxidase family protein [Methylobacter sp.]
MFYFTTRTTLLTLIAGLSSMPTLAADNVPPDPACIYQETDLKTYGGQAYVAPKEIRSVDGKLNAELNVVFTNSKEAKKTEETKIAGCKVSLRSYNGELVGPTLRVKPGDTLNITLTNQLGQEGKAKPEDLCNNPHDAFGGSPLPDNFNCTNLHTHGMHVSPSGAADNVLVKVPPVPYTNPDKKVSNGISSNPRQITINIPKNHSPGTYWYHPHVHGSTGVQVGSGMEGAIIVEDDPAKTPDSIIKANANEKIFMLQTIPYDDTGKVNDFLALGDDRAFVRNRYLLVNGQIAPTIKMHPGEVQRWRFIDSSFNRTAQLSLEKHDLHEIAVDGNYLSQRDTWVNNWEQKDYCCTGKWDQEQTFKLKRQTVELIPGSRSDILVQASKTPGRYKLSADTYITGRLDPSTASFTDYVVAWIEVDGDPVADTGLPSNEEMAKLYPYTDVKNSNVKYNQLATFNRDQPLGGNDGGIACNPVKDKTPCYPIGFQVNGHVFDATQPRLLELRPNAEELAKAPEDDNGPQTGTDSWLIPSADATRNHVFHIHTNDFQTTRTDPLGNTETLWRDSLLVKYGQPQTILTRYEDFDGTTVLHCHLLSHEDMGMMQVIKFEKRNAAMIGH